MFFAYHWFEQPAFFTAAQNDLLEWAKSSKLYTFIAAGSKEVDNAVAGFEEKTLTAEDLLTLEVLSECAWLGSDFGGYTSSNNIGAINGFCHFELNGSRQRARLLALLDQAEVRPLQSQVLFEALDQLLRELRYIEKVELPFTDYSPEDIAALDKLNLVPDDQPSWWRQIYRVPQEPETLSSPSAISSLVSCVELRVTTAPELSDYTTRQLGRLGYDHHTFVDWQTIKGEEKPVVRTYLPFDNKVDYLMERVRRVQQKLAGPDKKIGEVEAIGRSSSEWLNIRSTVYPVVKIGQHLVVKPTDRTYASKPEEIVVNITPTPRVFGYFYSGFHPSTELCLELLEKYLKPSLHKKMLDLGTGTGLQAVAAAKLGAEKILALDAYSVAVEAAKANVAQNQVEQQIAVEYGSINVINYRGKRGLYTFTDDAQQPPSEFFERLPFDLITCNIIAHGVINLAEVLSQSLRPGGLLITSGITLDREKDVVNALNSFGLLSVERRDKDGWVGTVFIQQGE